MKDFKRSTVWRPGMGGFNQTPKFDEGTQAFEVGDDCVEVKVLELVFQQIRLTFPDALQ